MQSGSPALTREPLNASESTFQRPQAKIESSSAAKDDRRNASDKRVFLEETLCLTGLLWSGVRGGWLPKRLDARIRWLAHSRAGASASTVWRMVLPFALRGKEWPANRPALDQKPPRNALPASKVAQQYAVGGNSSRLWPSA